MSVQELEAAISKLPPDQLATLGEWSDEYRAEEWDRQIEADVEFVSLTPAQKRATADHLAERGKRGSRETLPAVLAKAPDVEPEAFDRL